jgi:hypothetical protein
MRRAGPGRAQFPREFLRGSSEIFEDVVVGARFVDGRQLARARRGDGRSSAGTRADPALALGLTRCALLFPSTALSALRLAGFFLLAGSLGTIAGAIVLFVLVFLRLLRGRRLARRSDFRRFDCLGLRFADRCR